MADVAAEVHRRSIATWGADQAVTMIGRSPAFLRLQSQLERAAAFDEPLLVTGESGVGKELMAQAVYLLSPRRGHPYVPVNCPQYREGNLTVSELFGHRRGAFTGAVADKQGCFESADGGVLFLDEIGDLHMDAQVLLLRALADGSFRPLGADARKDAKKSVNVRVLAATNRPLDKLRLSEQFRDDLFFRLRYFHLDLPPLREREDDWALLFDHFLARLAERHGVVRRLGSAAAARLAAYGWPGNVRELSAIATTGYAMARGQTIEVDEIEPLLDEGGAAAAPDEDDPWMDVVLRGTSFWDAVHQPFLARDLNRRQVRAVVARGLAETGGSYRRLLDLFNLRETDYQRFMDCLRHHDLKP